MLRSSLRCSDTLYGCAERSGEYHYVRQGQCTWGRVQGQEFKQRETGDNVGFDTSGWQVATGIRFDAGHDWQLGTALSWESNRLRTNGVGSSDGYQLNLGLSATRNVAAAQYSGSLAFGYADDDLSRTPAEGSGVSKATQKVKSVAGHLRAAYLFGDGGWYFKPWIDAGAEWLDMPGFSESGDSPFALRVQGQTDTYFQVQPALEVGTEFQADNGMRIRPRLTLALIQFLGAASPSASATFASTPGGVDPFRTSTNLDRTQLCVVALDRGRYGNCFDGLRLPLRSRGAHCHSADQKIVHGGIVAFSRFDPTASPQQ
ncbi:MAG: autotransporter outer membrane beta-barrel domain-containing protein [Burkholderiales bacterium]|nr:autotransporter outer membrane beta-barrel domain-containing protein [Burkholderiales bacterium]